MHASASAETLHAGHRPFEPVEPFEPQICDIEFRVADRSLRAPPQCQLTQCDVKASCDLANGLTRIVSGFGGGREARVMERLRKRKEAAAIRKRAADAAAVLKKLHTLQPAAHVHNLAALAGAVRLGETLHTCLPALAAAMPAARAALAALKAQQMDQLTAQMLALVERAKGRDDGPHENCCPCTQCSYFNDLFDQCDADCDDVLDYYEAPLPQPQPQTSHSPKASHITLDPEPQT
jgi:hypothetical protein